MWKVLPSDPHYAVSDDGQIKSLRKNQVLTPKKNHDGYLRIQLWDHCRCRFVSLHRLIAEAFLPPPAPDAIVINHKNGDKTDNRASNLEWVTQQENIRHAWRTGLSKSHLNRKGKAVRQLTKSGQMIGIFPSMMEAERVLGINHADISSAIQRNGTAGGFRWEVIKG